MLMLPVPTKERIRVKATMNEILFQEEMQMMSRTQEAMVIIKGYEGRKTSEVHQGNLHLPGTNVYFLVIVILVQTLVTWQNIVKHIIKIDVMVPNHLIEIDIIVPNNLQETILHKENMNSYS